MDNNLDTVVLSNRQINLSQNTELDALILKFYKGLKRSANSSKAILNDNSILNVEPDFNFLDLSKEIANQWFDNYEPSTKHSSLNLIFALISEEESYSFAMFETYSKPGFLRVSDESENDLTYANGIMMDTLASVKSAFIYNLMSQETFIKNTVDSKEDLETILGLEIIPNTKKSLEIVNAIVDYVSETREEDATSNLIKSKTLMFTNAELFEEVEPKRIIDTIFSDLDEEETEFIETSFEEAKISSLLPSEDVKKLHSLKKHKIQTEKSIEVTLPIDSLELDEILEIKHNQDGSVDIILKNVGGII